MRPSFAKDWSLRKSGRFSTPKGRGFGGGVSGQIAAAAREAVRGVRLCVCIGVCSSSGRSSGGRSSVGRVVVEVLAVVAVVAVVVVVV